MEYWGGDPKDRYVGVRFLIGGQTHYGWIRLTVTTSTEEAARELRITGYAYETLANKPILAGTAATAATAEKPTAAVRGPENIRIKNGTIAGHARARRRQLADVAARRNFWPSVKTLRRSDSVGAGKVPRKRLAVKHLIFS